MHEQNVSIDVRDRKIIWSNEYFVYDTTFFFQRITELGKDKTRSNCI